MQIEQLESPALLPTLEALEAEFGREDGQRAAGRRKGRCSDGRQVYTAGI